MHIIMNFSILKKSFLVKTPSKPYQDLENDETSFSVIRGEGLSINKILSRDSSFGDSARIYYGTTTNLGVPFQWEKKPGMPLIPPLEEVILHPTPPPPPPALQSLVLTQPNVAMKHSLSWRFWLWRRRLSKNIRLQMYHGRGYHTKFSFNARHNKVCSLDGDSDAEFVGWLHGDSKSSSSSTLSSSICSSNDQYDSFRKGVPFCCTTWRRYKSNDK